MWRWNTTIHGCFFFLHFLIFIFKGLWKASEKLRKKLFTNCFICIGKGGLRRTGVVCFHTSFCIVKKNDANTTFSVQLNLQNKMANLVPRAQVPTDSCSSHLSQLPLNVHREALEVQGKWKTVGWSIYCDMSNIRNRDVPSHFLNTYNMPGAVFHALTYLILTSIPESMYSHHLHLQMRQTWETGRLQKLPQIT